MRERATKLLLLLLQSVNGDRETGGKAKKKKRKKPESMMIAVSCLDTRIQVGDDENWAHRRPIRLILSSPLPLLLHQRKGNIIGISHTRGIVHYSKSTREKFDLRLLSVFVYVFGDAR